MLKVNILPRAEEDLIHIWIESCTEWDMAQADHYLDHLNDKIYSLAEFPEKYPIRKDFRPPVHICPHNSHIIIVKGGVKTGHRAA